MGKRLLVAGIVTLSIAAALSAVGEAGAARPPVTGAGEVQCRVTGKIKYNPPLGATTVPTTASVAAKLVCQVGETGSDLMLRGGKVLLTSTPVGMSCADADITELTGTVKWTARGGRVESSSIALAGGADLGQFDFASSGVASGSYTGAPVELFGRLGEPECGRRSIRKASIEVGAFHVGTACQDDVPTKSAPTLAADGHVWVVVAPACAYEHEDHPTGTLSYSYDTGAAPFCSTGPAVLVDSGMTAAMVPPASFPVDIPATYWGIDTGATVQQLAEECGPGSPQVTYSGDARYLGFVE
jgi:hypothetical protein